LKLKNNTDFPDWFLRRMISWVCKNGHIGWSTKKIRGGVEVRNRNKRYASSSGCAWPRGERMVLSIGTLDVFRPYLLDENGKHIKNDDGHGFKVADEPDRAARIRTLVELTAHEVTHLAQWEKTSDKGRYSEKEADRVARWVLEDFKKEEAALTAAWMEPPKYATKPKKEKPTIKERNAAKARANLKTWERKLKLAKTKWKKYEQQVRRYEKEGY